MCLPKISANVQNGFPFHPLRPEISYEHLCSPDSSNCCSSIAQVIPSVSSTSSAASGGPHLEVASDIHDHAASRPIFYSQPDKDVDYSEAINPDK